MTATTTAPTRLSARDLTLGYTDTAVVQGLDLQIPDGKVTVIVGANACGKSTLLRGLARLLKPRSGAVLLDGEAIHRLATKQVARTLGLLPQNPIAPEGVTVVDLVSRGRHPHHGTFRRWTSEDEEVVVEALRLTDTTALADRVVDELSGGQRQRVWIAMALAQGTDLLLLDEPTTFLDVAHQVEMLDLLADLNARRGTTIVMVLHDLNLSARYADHLVALRHGKVVAEGTPREVVTEEVVRTVFGLDNRVIDDPVSHTPLVVPVSRHRTIKEQLMTTSTDVLPLLLAEVEVVSVERLSPAFVRLELGGPELAEFGVDGPRYDQRIKLIFPDPVTGGITSLDGADESWLDTWLDQPTEERGHMRTYTIRDVRGSGADTTFVVDIVLHQPGDEVGPGSTWAAAAAVGDRLVMIAPRQGFPYGGIEFTAPAGADLLMVADETAVPAVCAVLEQLPPTATGAVFMEVPTAADFQDVRGPSGVAVTWLARGDAPLGQRLHDEVVAHLGTPGAVVEVAADEVDPDLWETPFYSSSGEQIPEARAVGHEFDGLYAWIAGESKVVTGLRRHLVNELHIDRSQVAFMGYWRRGVAMKS